MPDPGDPQSHPRMGHECTNYGRAVFVHSWIIRGRPPDTIVPNPGDPQALNRYIYVLNNPVKYTDPTGHAMALDDWGGTPSPVVIFGRVYDWTKEREVIFHWLDKNPQYNLASDPILAGETYAGALEPGIAAAIVSLEYGLWQIDRGMPSGADAAGAGILGLAIVAGAGGRQGSDVGFSGIRRASSYLREQGVPHNYRKQILESFDVETIRVRTAGAEEFGIRYYDNVNAMEKGRYLFETFPASRDSLAVMPEWNSMAHFKQWQIRPEATVIEGRAASQGRFAGGQIQKYILYLKDLLP